MSPDIYNKYIINEINYVNDANYAKLSTNGYSIYELGSKGIAQRMAAKSYLFDKMETQIAFYTEDDKLAAQFENVLKESLEDPKNSKFKDFLIKNSKNVNILKFLELDGLEIMSDVDKNIYRVLSSSNWFKGILNQQSNQNTGVAQLIKDNEVLIFDDKHTEIKSLLTKKDFNIKVDFNVKENYQKMQETLEYLYHRGEISPRVVFKKKAAKNIITNLVEAGLIENNKNIILNNNKDEDNSKFSVKLPILNDYQAESLNYLNEFNRLLKAELKYAKRSSKEVTVEISLDKLNLYLTIPTDKKNFFKITLNDNTEHLSNIIKVFTRINELYSIKPNINEQQVEKHKQTFKLK